MYLNKNIHKSTEQMYSNKFIDTINTNTTRQITIQYNTYNNIHYVTVHNSVRYECGQAGK